MPDILNFLKNTSPRSLNSFIFFTEKIMPCCGKDMRFDRGPQGGRCQNIRCFHCAHKWNICEDIGFIEDIEKDIPVTGAKSS